MKYDIFSALVSLRPGKGFSYKPEVGGYAFLPFAFADCVFILKDSKYHDSQSPYELYPSSFL